MNQVAFDHDEKLDIHMYEITTKTLRSLKYPQGFQKSKITFFSKKNIQQLCVADKVYAWMIDELVICICIVLETNMKMCTQGKHAPRRGVAS